MDNGNSRDCCGLELSNCCDGGRELMVIMENGEIKKHPKVMNQYEKIDSLNFKRSLFVSEFYIPLAQGTMLKSRQHDLGSWSIHVMKDICTSVHCNVRRNRLQYPFCLTFFCLQFINSINKEVITSNCEIQTMQCSINLKGNDFSIQTVYKNFTLHDQLINKIAWIANQQECQI